MSTKPSPTLIGVFTLAALLIGGAVLVILGAGKFFERSRDVLVYFDKTVYGLQVGSDVRFGGVRIGRVSSISVIIDASESRKIIPVVISLTEKDLDRISQGGSGSIDFSSEQGVKAAVKEGLRAGMRQQSLVTGQLYIELDLMPGSEGFIYQSARQPDLPVIPTIPTVMDELISDISDGIKKIVALDFESLLKELQGILENTNRQLAEIDLKTINQNIIGITGDIRGISRDGRLKSSLANLDATLIELKELSTKANAGFDPLLAELTQVTVDTRASLAKIEQAVANLGAAGDARSPILLDLRSLLQETERTSRTLQELSNDLKRNPNTLLRGRNTSE
jgi:paraquat-inducible protein B